VNLDEQQKNRPPLDLKGKSRKIEKRTVLQIKNVVPPLFAKLFPALALSTTSSFGRVMVFSAMTGAPG